MDADRSRTERTGSFEGPLLAVGAPYSAITSSGGEGPERLTRPSAAYTETINMACEPGKPLDNARHERFAQGVASGKSATGAYEDAGYQPDAGNASHLTANHKVSERIQELLDTMRRDAIDLHHVTKEVIIGGLMQIACHGKSEGARVAAWKLIGQANVIGLFVSEDENARPQNVPETLRAFAGDNDDLYRMLLERIPLAPSEKQ